MNLVFDHTQLRGEVERTMTDYVNKNAVPLQMSVPTVLHYNELNESRMIMSYHPDKVGEIIHGVLESFGQERNWKAGVYFDPESGFTHVFFGKNQDIVQFPTVFVSNVIGRA
jgi:hypothetical protein